jgi:hypothetical protein
LKIKNFKPAEFIIALIAGTVIAVPVFLLGLHREYPMLRALGDAFFVPAVALLGVAGITFAANDGSFDSFGYSLRYVFFNHYPSAGEAESFADYREKKQSKRKSPINILLAGLIFLIIAVVLVIVYYSASKG